jgi:hypothetical protein
MSLPCCRFKLRSPCRFPLLLAACIVSLLPTPARADIITPDILTVTNLSTGEIVATRAGGHSEFYIYGPPGTTADLSEDFFLSDPDDPLYLRDVLMVHAIPDANYFYVSFNDVRGSHFLCSSLGAGFPCPLATDFHGWTESFLSTTPPPIRAQYRLQIALAPEPASLLLLLLPAVTALWIRRQRMNA